MDSDALQRLKDGNETEIRGQYMAYKDSFVRYVSTAFRCDRRAAEDIYPEAFSILYFNIQNEKLKAPLYSSLQTYLNSIGWNLYHRRYLDKYNRDKAAAEVSETVFESKEFVEEALIQQDRAIHVRRLLNELGDPCKSLLYHVYYDEKSYHELATQLSVPEATLRKRKFDCLGKLRKLFDENKLEL